MGLVHPAELNGNGNSCDLEHAQVKDCLMSQKCQLVRAAYVFVESNISDSVLRMVESYLGQYTLEMWNIWGMTQIGLNVHF